jgi:hypothetical protein
MPILLKEQFKVMITIRTRVDKSMTRNVCFYSKIKQANTRTKTFLGTFSVMSFFLENIEGCVYVKRNAYVNDKKSKMDRS